MLCAEGERNTWELEEGPAMMSSHRTERATRDRWEEPHFDYELKDLCGFVFNLLL